jgi:hypothetical protein
MFSKKHSVMLRTLLQTVSMLMIFVVVAIRSIWSLDSRCKKRDGGGGDGGSGGAAARVWRRERGDDAGRRRRGGDKERREGRR